MKSINKVQNINYALRIACAMCFIGHGAFGIITKAIWCNYFAVFGIGPDLAYRLMPVVGSVDILMGVSLLVYPVRAVALWLVIWGFFTASLRPLSGEPFAELIERAGNYGTPLALLFLWGSDKRVLSWFQRMNPPVDLAGEWLKKLQLCLRITAFLILTGHGWLNLIGKKALMGQYTSLGFDDAHTVAFTAGLIEITAALLILVRPTRPLLAVFFVWKIGTELFYPQHELFEWIERGGSYGTLLALWFALESSGLLKKINEHFPIRQTTV